VGWREWALAQIEEIRRKKLVQTQARNWGNFFLRELRRNISSAQFEIGIRGRGIDGGRGTLFARASAGDAGRVARDQGNAAGADLFCCRREHNANVISFHPRR